MLKMNFVVVQRAQVVEGAAHVAILGHEEIRGVLVESIFQNHPEPLCLVACLHVGNIVPDFGEVVAWHQV